MRIVSIAQNVPGPVAVRRLVEEGAAAIKIEPLSGDQLERICKSWYDDLHARVRVERIDLKTTEGMERLRTLLETADVFLSSQRPSALIRLGVDAATLQHDYPRLRCVNIVGSTADPEDPGHDLTYQAQAGLIAQSMPLTLIGDMVGADRASAAIKEAMHEPGSTRVIGLFDALHDLATPLRYGLTAAGGWLGGGNPAYAIYRAREGTVAVAALEPHFRSRLYEGLGLPDGADLTTIFATRPAAEWQEWAAARDLPLVMLHSGSAPTSNMSHMGAGPKDDILETAQAIAKRYLASVADRHVGGTATRQEMLTALGGPLPRRGADPIAVLQELAANADPGIVASAGPRYFGFVTGGAVPVAVAADWLASAWDQNGAFFVMSPALSTMEDVVAAWLLELLDLPRNAGVGFVTGCHMANFTCLAAARHEVLRRAGWNVETQGLQRAPRVRVLAGGEVHISTVGALRYLGFGSDEVELIPADGQGRMRADALVDALARSVAPTIVCAQAGNVSTGATDPLDAIVAAAHAKGAWVHVDAAFGLWAAAVPEMRAQVTGIAHADSWATDAHKWLNVPYDSGLAIVADAAPHRAAMSLKASYLQRGPEEERIGTDWVPESSRRARVVPLYALIRALGAEGIAGIVRSNCALARRMAERLSKDSGVTILNEVVLNQVLVQFGDTASRPTDEMTRDVIARVQAEGTCWAGGAIWQDKQVMRISVSNWSTTEADIDRSADAILKCYDAAKVS